MGWLRRAARFTWRLSSETLGSIDFVFGAVVGALVWWLSSRYDEIRGLDDAVLVWLIPLSVVLVGYVANQSNKLVDIVSQRPFNRVIERVGGIRSVLRPVRIAKAIASLVAVYSLIARLVLEVASPFVSTILLGVGVGGFVWALVGAIQIHGLVLELSTQNYNLASSIDEADDILAKRRRRRDAG